MSMPATLLIDPTGIERVVTPRTRALLAVDYAGQPCDYEALGQIARRHGLALVSDACHSLGAKDQGQSVGSLADLSTFSLHPAKVITTGEGGMITTNDSGLAQRMREFRQHGISVERPPVDGTHGWFYEQQDLGFNYRLTDFQAALGISQLQRLPRVHSSAAGDRRALTTRHLQMGSLPPNRMAMRLENVEHAYHLYVLRPDCDSQRLAADRATIYAALRAEGIGVQVHYIPVHLHRYYQQHFATRPGNCPTAERGPTSKILSLPIFPGFNRRRRGRRHHGGA